MSRGTVLDEDASAAALGAAAGSTAGTPLPTGAARHRALPAVTGRSSTGGRKPTSLRLPASREWVTVAKTTSETASAVTGPPLRPRRCLARYPFTYNANSSIVSSGSHRLGLSVNMLVVNMMVDESLVQSPHPGCGYPGCFFRQWRAVSFHFQHAIFF